MRINDITMSIVIITPNGEHTAREYNSPQNRQTYIEGREGSNFILRLTNNTPSRVLAVPSVDGLSVLDGKAAGKDSGGYIIEGRQTLDIPGWKLDGDTAAQFFFAGKKHGQDGSYAAQSGQDTANKGVIGLRVYSEKYHDRYRGVNVRSSFRGGQLGGAIPKGMYGSSLGSASSWNDGARGIAPSSIQSSSAAPSSSWNAANASSAGLSPPVSVSVQDHSYAISNNMASYTTDSAPDPLMGISLEQTLGTGFGEAKDFATTEATFQRGDLVAQMVIYYGDHRQLAKVGIDVSKPISRGPSAFPADTVGCVPPVGWKK